jgi:hypothetical protein
VFVSATVIVLVVAIRGRRAAARATEVPSWVRELEAPATAMIEG